MAERSTASTIALVDFNWYGHHPAFFRAFYEALCRAGKTQVVCFCPRPDVVRGWSNSTGEVAAVELQDDVLRHRWIRKVPALANWFRFRACSNALQEYERREELRFDLVFFACLYSGAFPSPRLANASLPYRWTALLVDSISCRQPFARRLLSLRTTDPLAVFRAADCASLGTLDEFIVPKLSRRIGSAKKVVHVPEVIDTGAPNPRFPLAEGVRVAAAGRAVIGCLGQFNRRKGALLFLDTAKASESEPWLFVWAGEYRSESFTASERMRIQRYLTNPPRNCLLHFERIDDGADFNAIVAACDLLLLCYANHLGSSNLVTKAAFFEKPLVASNAHCVADQLRRYQLGTCVGEAAAPAELRGAITEQLNRAVSKACFAEYLRVYSRDRFDRAVGEMIEPMLGRNQAAAH